MAEKKFYWLKLKEDFFDEDTIQWLEEQTNGKEYCLFYLKLCLKSLKSNGLLIRNVGNILIPYDCKKLSEITRTSEDTVRVAMNLFKEIGLVQILDNGEIFLTQLENMVGSESKWAKYKREKKALPSNETKRLENFQSNSNDTPKKLQTEKEIEIELQQDKDKEKEKIDSGGSDFNIFKYAELRNFILSPIQIQQLQEDINIYSLEEVKKALDIADDNGKHTYSYVKGILQKRRANGEIEVNKDGSANKSTEDTKSEEPQYKFEF